MESCKTRENSERIHLIRKAGIKRMWKIKYIKLGKSTCLHFQKEVTWIGNDILTKVPIKIIP